MPYRVLIIDDNDMARVILKDMLVTYGHEVAAEAENLREALKAYEAHKPDIVTLDLSLAFENGLTVLKALRQLDPKAKILIISGNSQKKVQEEVLTAGAAGFLGKPFEMEELISTINRLFPDPMRDALTQWTTSALEKGLKSLAKASGVGWAVRGVNTTTLPVEQLQLTAAVPGRYFGAHLLISSGGLLILFPPQSDSLLARPGLVSVRKATEAEPNLEWIAELSNILAQSMAGEFAALWQAPITVSAPEMAYDRLEALFRLAPSRFKAGGGNFTLKIVAQFSAASLPANAAVVILLNSEWKDRLTKDLQPH